MAVFFFFFFFFFFFPISILDAHEECPLYFVWIPPKFLTKNQRINA